MAADVSIQIKSTDTSGNKITSTISDVNPQATAANLLTFAQMMNSLTSNNYNETIKITREVLDNV